MNCCMRESCIDWKGRGGVALLHPFLTSDDMKLISMLVSGTSSIFTDGLEVQCKITNMGEL